MGALDKLNFRGRCDLLEHGPELAVLSFGGGLGYGEAVHAQQGVDQRRHVLMVLDVRHEM